MERPAGVGPEEDPAELEQLPGAQVGRERRDEIVADERQPDRSPDARHLVERRLQDLLLAARPREVRLARLEKVAPDPRVDERPAAVHVLRPALEPPARPPRATLGGGERAVEAIRADRPRNIDLDPADRVDQLLEAVEVDDGDVIHVQAGQLPNRAERQRRAADLIGRVDLPEPDLRDLDLQVAGDREVREPPLPGVGADEHDRVGAVGPLAPGSRAPVRPEDEHRPGRGDEQAVGRRELPADTRGHPLAGFLDAVRHGEVPTHGPRDEQRYEKEEREDDPAPAMSTTARRRRSGSGRRAAGARRRR